MRVLRRSEIEPESGSSRPARICSSVDLPAPLGPISPSRSPSEIPSEIFSKSTREPKLLASAVQLARSGINDQTAERKNSPRRRRGAEKIEKGGALSSASPALSDCDPVEDPHSHYLFSASRRLGGERFRSEEHTSELQSLRHLVC